MRLFSLLPMILAAIFFAGSVSADHYCAKSKSLGGKIYKVCKSWRVDQGGPMPTDLMQHCRNVLCDKSEGSLDCAETHAGKIVDHRCVGDDARERAKPLIGDFWN